MQTVLVKPKVVDVGSASPEAMVSGRPNGGRMPRRNAAALREWKSSDHFMLDTLASRPPRAASIPGGLPLARIENPGHSWLLVHLRHVAALGAAGRISGFSHIVGSSAALEEDCDAPAVIGALEEKTGGKFDWNGSVRTVYDGLFEWDYAYENFAAARFPAGEEHVLRPYSAAAAIAAASASFDSAPPCAAERGRRP